MRAALCLLALVSGCSQADPCAGVTGTCIALFVDDTPQIDTLAVHAATVGWQYDHSSHGPNNGAFSAPIAVALSFGDTLFDSAPTDLTLAVTGQRNQADVGNASVFLSVKKGDHLTAHVRLIPGNDDMSLADLAGTVDDGGNLLDLAPDLGLVKPPVVCTSTETIPDTSVPTTVVGTGPGSCTRALLAAAVATGGVVTFNCGPSAVISIDTAIDVPTDRDTTIDGKGAVTLDGGGKSRIFTFNGAGYRVNTHRLSLLGLQFANAKASGTMPYASAPSPCSQGFYDGYGGAIQLRDGVLLVVDSVFVNDKAELLGPDVGGGAISVNGGLKATIIGSVFQQNVAANGGAISSLNTNLNVYNSRFADNVAAGNGGNFDTPTECSVVATTGQHQVGSGGNAGAIYVDGSGDTTHTYCGVVFSGNHAGLGGYGGALFRVVNASKQTTSIDRCLFDGNAAPTGQAGALYIHGSTLQIHASTLRNNSAQSGGAVQCDNTTLDLVNSTFDSNTALGNGAGAIAAFAVDGSILNCTFTNNTASTSGAAIFGTPTATVQNTIFQNNLADSSTMPMQCAVSATGTSNLQFPRNHKVGGSPDSACATMVSYVDAQLGTIGDHGGPTPTLVPLTGSPALFEGTACPATDQRGMTRPVNGCTAGAVEGTN